ncbi:MULTISPECIES: DUF2218 domain-containing protein [Acinetobacter]|jgi:hypothetical protein|uniref:DUF2218 domain-containing protein n=1 Tax=Acinetobacter chengduensis TaxID=2420890 RepID=A0ABX9TTT3_9GAMM|nr:MULTISPECIES: DUF2218 domain-containing protein [Acinetobacter]MBI1453072.1 DUF2218 domain-containing protein [Acinetobacter sp. FL51]RKG39591.1 DUF2218 domain-containing protein [Acinetobacter sp. WCHAc060007]RLL19151.1 DUF2218 domain-containing protein [Acinetobacter chengduensis]
MHQYSEAKIVSAQPARIAKRLLNHWKHKFETTEEAELFSIFMPTATIFLQPEAGILKVRIQPKEENVDLERLENVVLDHLIRMGQESLHANWLHS